MDYTLQAKVNTVVGEQCHSCIVVNLALVEKHLTVYFSSHYI